MKPNNLSSQINSDILNEHLYKRYGVRIMLEQHSREKLEDFRNRLRTNLAETERSAMFNDLIHNEEYQRGKFMIGVINQKLKEMLGEARKTVKEKAVSKAQQKAAGIALAAKKEGKKPAGKGAAAAMAKMPKKELKKIAGTSHKGLPDKKGKKMTEDKAAEDKAAAAKAAADAKQDNFDERLKAAKAQQKQKIADKVKKNNQYFPQSKSSTSEGKKFKPDFLDLNRNNNFKEPMSKAAREANAARKAKKRRSRKAVNESYRRHIMTINENVRRLINEDEEGKAIAITAGADMVNDFTSWMQRVGQLQTKSMIELADSIRSNFGQSESEAFKTSVQPALAAALDALTQSREQISRAVATLAGEEEIPMGTQEFGQDMIGQDTDDQEMPDQEMPDQDIEGNTPNQEDNFAASDAAAGGSEVAGREMRESRVLLKAKKLAESNNLMRKLAGV